MNIRPRLITVLSAAMLAACVAPLCAQDLPCEKYKLDNGLTVILHVDHALPTVTINLWYHVGAKNEPPGRSGFAHLFEHLMFMGTKRAPGNTFDTMMEALGGGNNASTELDRTNYFSEGPSESLPTLLWLDADRMEALGANMTTEKLNRQRDVVRNEIRQQVENTPYGRAYEEMFRYMFPVGHPYHNAVYGTHADLEAATQLDVRDFFATFYNPSNCSLVVAGDFDPATTRPLIEKLYGSLPAGNAPKDRAVAPAKLDHVVRATMLDKIELPKILMVYHAPGTYQPGEAELALAARVLGEGENSRLYQRLVLHDQSCVEVSVFPYGGQLQSLLLVDVSAKPGTDLAKVEKAIDQELAAFTGKGPTADELAQRKIAIELGSVSSLQSIQARADKLNEYEFYLGEPNSLKRDLDRYRNATIEGVRDVAKATLTPQARLIMTILPEGTSAPSPRDTMPAASAEAAKFKVPSPEIFTLASGVKVELFHKPELPLISATLLAQAPGLTMDAPDKAGRGDLLASMLSEGTGEGTGELDAPAFASALQSLGGDFGANADRTALTTSLTVLDRNFDKAAKLWLDATLRPRMKAEDFDRVKKLTLDDLQQKDRQPGYVAAKVGQALLYGHDTPYGTPESGNAKTVGALTLDDLQAQRTELLADPTKLTIFVAGNVTRAGVIAALDPLIPKGVGAHEAMNQSPAQAPAFTGADAMRVVIVNRPDAPQTTIRLVTPGIAYADKLRIPLALMNTVLGGSFTSRLNANLREDKGYTYGANSGFRTDVHTGSFVASADVKADVTGASVKEMLAELHGIVDRPITADEFKKARQAYRAELVNRFASQRSLLGMAVDLSENGVAFESLDADAQAAAAATVDQLNAAAHAYPKLAAGTLILVGDEALIREQLKDLNLPSAVTCDADGALMK